jgi:hypothetical protein
VQKKCFFTKPAEHFTKGLIFLKKRFFYVFCVSILIVSFMLNLQEISQQSAQHLQHYLESLSAYQNSSFLQKTDAETWSLGELYEHLLVSSTYFLRQAEGCLREEKGSFEGEKTLQGEQMFALGGFPPIKIKVPEKYKSATELSVQDIDYYQKRFQELLDYLPKVQKAIEGNPSSYKRQHAIFGMLTATEWIWCLETHLRHHLRQQKELEEKIA